MSEYGVSKNYKNAIRNIRMHEVLSEYLPAVIVNLLMEKLITFGGPYCILRAFMKKATPEYKKNNPDWRDHYPSYKYPVEALLNFKPLNKFEIEKHSFECNKKKRTFYSTKKTNSNLFIKNKKDGRILKIGSKISCYWGSIIKKKCIQCFKYFETFEKKKYMEIETGEVLDGGACKIMCCVCNSKVKKKRKNNDNSNVYASSVIKTFGVVECITDPLEIADKKKYNLLKCYSAIDHEELEINKEIIYTEGEYNNPWCRVLKKKCKILSILRDGVVVQNFKGATPRTLYFNSSKNYIFYV